MTAFQAVHWFDFDSFTTECTRVLCPNGVLAMIGYNLPEPIDPWNPDDRSLVELMYDLYTDERLAPFKNPKIVPLERHYRDIKLPDNYELSLKDNNWTSKRVAAQDIVGYVQSWSLYQGLQNADRETAELLTQEVIHRLKSILKISKAHADIYARFRPAVPEEVVHKVVHYLADKLPPDVEEDNTNRWTTGVDVGCGSGQGTNAMAKHFANCYGFDVSPAQIEAAIRSTHPSNVCYQVCPAESMPSIETNSVQMVTAFECFQYFDYKKFMEECTRVLVDNGVVAVIGYFIPDPSDPLEPNRDPSLVDLMQECYNSDRLAAYKSPNVASVEKHYKNVTFPTNYESKHVDHIIASVPVLAEDMVGLIESWSSFQKLVKADKESAQLFRREIREKLSAILKTNDLSAKEIVFNYTANRMQISNLFYPNVSLRTKKSKASDKSSVKTLTDKTNKGITAQKPKPKSPTKAKEIESLKQSLRESQSSKQSKGSLKTKKSKASDKSSVKTLTDKTNKGITAQKPKPKSPTKDRKTVSPDKTLPKTVSPDKTLPKTVSPDKTSPKTVSPDKTSPKTRSPKSGNSGPIVTNCSNGVNDTKSQFDAKAIIFRASALRENDWLIVLSKNGPNISCYSPKLGPNSVLEYDLEKCKEHVKRDPLFLQTMNPSVVKTIDGIVDYGTDTELRGHYVFFSRPNGPVYCLQFIGEPDIDCKLEKNFIHVLPDCFPPPTTEPSTDSGFWATFWSVIAIVSIIIVIMIVIISVLYWKGFLPEVISKPIEIRLLNYQINKLKAEMKDVSKNVAECQAINEKKRNDFPNLTDDEFEKHMAANQTALNTFEGREQALKMEISGKHVRRGLLEGKELTVGRGMGAGEHMVAHMKNFEQTGEVRPPSGAVPPQPPGGKQPPQPPSGGAVGGAQPGDEIPKTDEEIEVEREFLAISTKITADLAEFKDKNAKLKRERSAEVPDEALIARLQARIDKLHDRQQSQFAYRNEKEAELNRLAEARIAAARTVSADVHPAPPSS
ncbi:unnamed protein product [Medioppia subpectinata]|uniref:Methyltransferase type 11 domain-containing protein n=1 Tax=Medioppia subpectinata TaxID=1979941 RepID=A0A7R9PXK5_9ACAR|nr:unnamed protein product [Medioppia subpectinata]CAG2105100.1 unnamed protein product [Medioppia subpectinata]